MNQEPWIEFYISDMMEVHENPPIVLKMRTPLKVKTVDLCLLDVKWRNRTEKLAMCQEVFEYVQHTIGKRFDVPNGYII
jgi:hypothetical protein